MMKALKIILIIAVSLVILSVPLIIPIMNDFVALSVKNDLKKLPIPDKTQLIDSVSAAGNLVGSGNGMQYFGAILIQSELTLDELNDYYSQFQSGVNDWAYQVEEQKDKHIDLIEHGDYAFSSFNQADSVDHFIVYSWGDSNNAILVRFDLRGH